MSKYNANNERIKRRYFTYLKEAKRQSEDSVDAASTAIARFEVRTDYRDFKTFHIDQAVAFKRGLAKQQSQITGKSLSKATLNSTLAQLKRFFFWLADQPGYRGKIKYSDADYFNLSEKEARIASAKRPRPVPTLEQVHHVLDTMPADNELQLRDRAVIAFTLLTGARDSATASLKLKHVDVDAASVFQDAREVTTKFSKSFMTYFFPVNGNALVILTDWVRYLRSERLWGNDAPLFPATRMELGPSGQFEAAGIKPEHWSTAGPIREIFKSAFAAAGLCYFNPHSVRNTLVRLGETRCKTPEEFKAWSQNLGHEGVLTTFTSYGMVPRERQADILRKLESKPISESVDEVTYRTLMKALKDSGVTPTAS
ncbi:site-specific integrase [Luteimonas mephitis]|uniref:site-specific integrase n=1 Tax=Luteimonas mephitis TaxID=83615 RepID=UPI003A8E1A0B